MPTPDHFLLVQFERRQEDFEQALKAIESEVDKLDGSEKFCDCDCNEGEIEDVAQDVRSLESKLDALDARLSHVIELLGEIVSERFRS